MQQYEHERQTCGQSKGHSISIKLLTFFLFLAAVIAASVSFYEVESTRSHTQALYELEGERQKCDEAIRLFMDGSDFLTADIQQYVITADRRRMDDYWREVYQTQTRDTAIESILKTNVNAEEREMAIAAKAESDRLMGGETWAMRMVAESVGMDERDMPRDVAAYSLSAQDAALAPEEKQARAISYIFGPEYSLVKSAIRANVNDFRNRIASRFSTEALAALDNAKKNLSHTEVLLLCVLLVMLGTLAVYLTLVVIPITRYSKELTRKERGSAVLLSERGATELQLFARALNELYAQVEHNTERLRRLGYIDFLTDVPNRASITEYAENAIMSNAGSIGLLIVDVDNFKCYNDVYGHTIGDATLVRIAKAVCSAQAREDGIAGRLCGEEFIVIVRDATLQRLADTAQKILENVRSITAEEVSLPADTEFRVTVSIGGSLWQGGAPTSFIKLLSDADQAMYASKTNGKDRFTMSSEACG